MLTEKDDIVPVRAVEELFSEFNRGKEKLTSQCTEVRIFEEAAHGEMFFIDSLRAETVGMVADLVRKADETSGPISGIDPIGLIKKEYEALLHETGEFWDQISYILPTRATSEEVAAPLKRIF